MRRTPLRSKRQTPRRKAPERVQHARMKPKRGAMPTAEQERYHRWLRGEPAPRACEGCGSRIDTVIHHILAAVEGKVARRDHWFVVLLCAQCHNMGTKSVHLLGSEAEFLRVHGVDLVAISIQRLSEWEETHV